MTQTHHGRAGGGRGEGASAAAGGFPYPHESLAEPPAPVRQGGRHGAPPDLASMAETMTLTELALHYRCARQTASRWLAAGGIKAQKREAPNKIPIPTDLAERAVEMSKAELARHYGVDFNTAARWVDNAGITARAYFKPRTFQRATAPKPRAYTGPKSAFTATLPRNVSTEGQAADFLRRDTRVFGCTAEGRYVDDPKKRTHWLYGTRVMTGAELVERARAKGWNPEGWRSVAAHQSQRQGLPQSQGA